LISLGQIFHETDALFRKQLNWVYNTNLQPYFGWRFFVFKNHRLNFGKTLIFGSRIGQ